MKKERMARHAHHNYKIPYKDAHELADKMNLTNLKRSIKGGIKNYVDTYGDKIDLTKTSLEKRIAGAIQDYYARLLFDRYLINWLCENRIDLSTVNGELRNALMELIKSTNESPERGGCEG